MTVFMNVEAIKEAGGGGYIRTGSWDTHTQIQSSVLLQSAGSGCMQPTLLLW